MTRCGRPYSVRGGCDPPPGSGFGPGLPRTRSAALVPWVSPAGRQGRVEPRVGSGARPGVVAFRTGQDLRRPTLLRAESGLLEEPQRLTRRGRGGRGGATHTTNASQPFTSSRSHLHPHPRPKGKDFLPFEHLARPFVKPTTNAPTKREKTRSATPVAVSANLREFSGIQFSKVPR